MLSVFGSFPLLALAFVFALAAGAVWVAGVRLSDTTDVLLERFGLGQALGGLILLAVVTNLPEIAITASASLSGELGIAVGNILGGIAIQTAVLVLVDAFGVRGGRPLSYRAASLSLVLEGTLVIIVLAVTVMSSQLPSSADLRACNARGSPHRRVLGGRHRAALQGPNAPALVGGAGSTR